MSAAAGSILNTKERMLFRFNKEHLTKFGEGQVASTSDAGVSEYIKYNMLFRSFGDIGRYLVVSPEMVATNTDFELTSKSITLSAKGTGTYPGSADGCDAYLTIDADKSTLKATDLALTVKSNLTGSIANIDLSIATSGVQITSNTGKLSLDGSVAISKLSASSLYIGGYAAATQSYVDAQVSALASIVSTDTERITAVNELIAAYSAADESLEDTLTAAIALKANITYVDGLIDALTTSVNTADTTLQDNIDALATSVNTANSTLQDNIDLAPQNAASETITGAWTFSGNQQVFTRSVTMGGTLLSNAFALFGSTSKGIGIDNNEIVGIGDTMYIGTGSNHELQLKVNAAAGAILTTTGLDVTNALTVGAGAKITHTSVGTLTLQRPGGNPSLIFTNTSYSDTQGQIYGDVNSTGQLLFRAYSSIADNTYYQMLLSNSGLAIGKNTINSGYALDIVGSAYATGNYYSTKLSGDNFKSPTVNIRSASGIGVIENYGSGGLYIYGGTSSASYPLYLGMNQTTYTTVNTKLSVNKSTEPDYALDVYGSIAYTTDLVTTSTGNNTAAPSGGLRVNGYGLMANRTTLHITNNNSSGSIQFNLDGVHGDNRIGMFESTGFQVDGNIIAANNLRVSSKSTFGDVHYNDNDGVVNVRGSGRNMLVIQVDDNTSDRGIVFRNSGGAYTTSIFVEENTDTSNAGDLVFAGIDGTVTDITGLIEYMRISKDGEMVSTNYNTTGCNLRLAYSTYANSVMLRNDGSNLYFLISDTQTGTWNNLRPLRFSLTNGAVTMAHSVTVGGTLAVTGATTLSSTLAVSGLTTLSTLKVNSTSYMALAIGATDSEHTFLGIHDSASASYSDVDNAPNGWLWRSISGGTGVKTCMTLDQSGNLTLPSTLTVANLTVTNDGSGSGIDADTVDGYEASAFAFKDTLDAQNFYESGVIVGISGTSNVDHIWHDDSNNRWHMVSDAAYGANGNSSLRVGKLGIGANATNALDVVGSGTFTGNVVIDGSLTVGSISLDTVPDKVGYAFVLSNGTVSYSNGNISFSGSGSGGQVEVSHDDLSSYNVYYEAIPISGGDFFYSACIGDSGDDYVYVETYDETASMTGVSFILKISAYAV